MIKIDDKFWNERYSTNEYVYGVNPNKFFKNEIDKLNAGKLLSLGEGEGRNAVYAASKGWDVDAVDFSKEAQDKAFGLAKEKKVKITYQVENLRNYTPKENFYDAVSIIFLHLNSELSREVHKKAIDALKINGKLILEVYSKEQLNFNSGGPKNPDALYAINDIRNNFKYLKIDFLDKEIINVDEGKYHSGAASVINFLGIKV